MVAPQLRELPLDSIQHLVAAQPGAFCFSLGQLIAVANQSLQAVLAPLVGEVSTLDASHFGIAEPVGYLIYLQFMLQLGEELCVVDGTLVVYELTLGNLDAEVASATRLVAEGLSLVGGSQERGKAPTVLLPHPCSPINTGTHSLPWSVSMPSQWATAELSHMILAIPPFWG